MAKRSTPTFDEFWQSYGLKRDKIAAERAWRRLSATDQRAALSGVASYRADCTQSGISMMYAQGYLSHRRWEDEYADPVTGIVNTPSIVGDDPVVESVSQHLDDMEIW